MGKHRTLWISANLTFLYRDARNLLSVGHYLVDIILVRGPQRHISGIDPPVDVTHLIDIHIHRLRNSLHLGLTRMECSILVLKLEVDSLRIHMILPYRERTCERLMPTRIGIYSAPKSTHLPFEPIPGIANVKIHKVQVYRHKAVSNTHRHAKQGGNDNPETVALANERHFCHASGMQKWLLCERSGCAARQTPSNPTWMRPSFSSRPADPEPERLHWSYAPSDPLSVQTWPTQTW